MLLRALLGLLILTTAAVAQDASSEPPRKIPPNYTLSVTPAELDIIGNGLQSQPYGNVAPLMSKLQKQIDDQQKAAAPKPSTAPPAPATPPAPPAKAK